MTSSSQAFAIADKRTATEIRRQAELMLSAQLQTGIAADQRAISFSSLLATGAALIAGAGASLILGDDAIRVDLGWTCFGVAGALLVSMLLANLSARPVAFWCPGDSPSNWLPDLAARKPFDVCMGEVLADYADRIDKNGSAIKRNAWLFAGAIWLAWVGLVTGAIIAILLLK